MALLDEMLAACAGEVSNRSLELIFSSHLFHQNRQEKFIGRLAGNVPTGASEGGLTEPFHVTVVKTTSVVFSRGAEELPKKVDSITPYTMALIAKYVARHRLRDVRLLDTVADFLVKKVEYLDSKVRTAAATRRGPRKRWLVPPVGRIGFLVTTGVSACPQVIQKLVFPFSRMSYRPSNEQQFFSRLEEAVELKALSSPLATVNILMSLFQLGHFPGLVLHRVFSSAFINNVTSRSRPGEAAQAPAPMSRRSDRAAGVLSPDSPYALIVRRYLSLLDAAVGLEYREYSGPRLQDAHKVLMFDHALTADEVNRKYRYEPSVRPSGRGGLGAVT